MSTFNVGYLQNMQLVLRFKWMWKFTLYRWNMPGRHQQFCVFVWFRLHRYTVWSREKIHIDICCPLKPQIITAYWFVKLVCLAETKSSMYVYDCVDITFKFKLNSDIFLLDVICVPFKWSFFIDKIYLSLYQNKFIKDKSFPLFNFIISILLWKQVLV